MLHPRLSIQESPEGRLKSPALLEEFKFDIHNILWKFEDLISLNKPLVKNGDV